MSKRSLDNRGWMSGQWYNNIIGIESVWTRDGWNIDFFLLWFKLLLP